MARGSGCQLVSDILRDITDRDCRHACILLLVQRKCKRSPSQAAVWRAVLREATIAAPSP